MVRRAVAGLAGLGFVDDGDWNRHWIGGHATGVQGAASRPGTVLLLHLADDADIGFSFLDGGAIQFRIPADALAARDWSQVFAEADSC